MPFAWMVRKGIGVSICDIPGGFPNAYGLECIIM